MIPRRYWIAYHPQGTVWPGSFAYSRSRAIQNIVAEFNKAGGGASWRKLRREGFRTAQVELLLIKTH